MSRPKLEIGAVYGYLTVKEYAYEKRNKRGEKMQYYYCECVCGNIKPIEQHCLITKGTKSCGCMRWKQKDVDLSGQRFGRLVALKEVESRTTKSGKRQRYWLCECDCGNMHEVEMYALTSGNTKSCGCSKREPKRDMTLIRNKHQRLYRVWVGMRERCLHPYHESSRKNYKDAGVQICDEWMDFENFCEWALANGYDENAPYGKCTIDRIDTRGNYEPSNCRWVDNATNLRNKRSVRRYTVFGETLTDGQLAEKYGFKRGVIAARIEKYGFTPEEAVTIKSKMGAKYIKQKPKKRGRRAS